MEKKQNFTKAYLDNLPNAETGKRYMVYDSTIPQLAVRVTDKGNKSFLIQKRHNGSILKITLGKYPEMAIAQARKKAVEVCMDYLKGKIPMRKKAN